MFTVSVGKQLIACLNRRDGTEWTPRAFFDEVYFPLFFGSARFLQNVNNSPVDQAYKMRSREPLTPSRLAASREEIHRKAETTAADGSFYLGGPARGTLETTSGQVTNLEREVSPDDIYASWIGAALGIGINGGLSLLIPEDEVLLALFDGWSRYRRYLEELPTLKPMQINTWNGQWLTWRFGPDWDADALMPIKVDSDATGGRALKTQTWVQLLFALAYRFQEQEARKLTAYVYSLGQTNRTVGFIQLDLPEVRLPFHLYKQLFQTPKGLRGDAFLQLYETEFSFLTASEQGSIGLRALQPKGLRKYMPDRWGGNKPFTVVVSESTPEQQVTGEIYQVWIIAMLKNTELLKRAETTAAALHAYTELAKRGKTTYDQQIRGVLDAPNLRAFIEGLTTLLQRDGEKVDLFDQVVLDLASLPESSVPLFLTLVRFKYAVVSKRSSS